MTAAQIEEMVRLLGEGVGRSLDDTFGVQRVGYAVLLFDFGDDGTLAYTSNGDRGDMIRALRELLTKLTEAPRLA